MKKERAVASRLPEDLVRDLELVEQVEQTDRATAIRKLLATALEEWKLNFYARKYGEGELTLGKASEEARVSLWRMLDYLRRKKIAPQYDLEDLGRDIATVRAAAGRARRKRTARNH
ncbi:MAG: UPF0175 family protein [Gemmatimonadetes bacterium]|nr:UPF0175 family protein [Gemmatimonadota bacterium]